MALCPVVSCSALTWKRAIFVLDYGHCFLLIAFKPSLGASGYRETPQKLSFNGAESCGFTQSTYEMAPQTHGQHPLPGSQQPFHLSRRCGGGNENRKRNDLLRRFGPALPAAAVNAPAADPGIPRPSRINPPPAPRSPQQRAGRRSPQCSGPALPAPPHPEPVTPPGPSPAPGALTENKVVWPEYLAEGPGAHRVHGAGLQVHQHGAGHVLATCKTGRGRDCGAGGGPGRAGAARALPVASL